MNITVYPGMLSGSLRAVPSKSQAHRLLICAAFSDKKTDIYCPDTNQDIEATAQCLRALGADILRTEDGYRVAPISAFPKEAQFYCCESGSTLRFMLPIAGALGVRAVFHMEGRLSQRPLSPLWEELQRMGCQLAWLSDNALLCQGQLKSGMYSVSGSVSSQFITGLLFALALIPGQSRLTVTGKVESAPYIRMTQEALAAFGVNTVGYQVNGSFPFTSPGRVTVEGDWSSSAFFLAANALGSKITLSGLNPNSPQGDKAILSSLERLGRGEDISGADIPDLIPVLAVAAGRLQGCHFTDIARLRLKESDRIESTSKMLTAFGAKAESTEDSLTVFPAQYRSCTVDSCGDHRIAMSAAIGATVAQGPVTILGGECVAKSYPGFWYDFKRLGGHYEQHLR